MKEQQRHVLKVLLDGLNDPDSPISELLSIRTEVMGEIIWQKLVLAYLPWSLVSRHWGSAKKLSLEKKNLPIVWKF